MLATLLMELERRVVLFNPNTTLPGGAPLGYDGNPADADPNNSDGEFLLYWSPQGTRYQTSTGVQYYKRVFPDQWDIFASTSGVGADIKNGIATYFDGKISTNDKAIVIVPTDLEITKIKGYVENAPIDDNIVVNITKNGSLVDSLVISAGTNTQENVLAQPEDVDYGDIIKIEVVNVGSSYAGKNLSILIKLSS